MVFLLARQNVGGLVKKTPHNNNYIELYNKTEDLNEMTEILNNKITNAENDITIIVDSLSEKVKIVHLTATSDNAFHLIHNLNYEPRNDDLIITYRGLLLEKNIHYVENSDNKSIDLLDWSINKNERIIFVLYKDIK